MSATDVERPRAGPGLNPLDWRQAWLTIDRNATALAFVATLPGRLALLAAFCGALALGGNLTTSALALIGLTLGAILVFPAHRLAMVCISSLVFVLLRPFRIDGWADLTAAKAGLIGGLSPMVVQVAAVGLFLAFAMLFLMARQRYADNAALRRPVVTLMAVLATVLLAAKILPQDQAASAMLWIFAGVYASCIWYLAYAAIDAKSRDATPLVARASLMRPFWGGSATPIGKSFGYLNKFDAKDDEDLAATRLKALKLAVWALLLTLFYNAVEPFLRGEAQVPQLNTAILAHAAGTPFSTAANWASLVSNYFLDLLVIAIWGHTIVAVVRMCGWRIPRNTVNPLASRSLAEFWNRYFFYFKELLVDFFFYPAFVRYFKTQPKLRIAFATFCAAALGNYLYHFLRETYVFAELDMMEALAVFQNAVFYSLALATGLIVSQLRKRKPQPEDGFWRYDVLPRLNVFAFFCFLKIFDDITGIGTLAERAAFTASLFAF